MLPWLMLTVRTYAPYVTLPFALVVGFIGYNIESLLHGPAVPHRPSVEEVRDERLLSEMLESSDLKLPPLNKQTFVPKSVFEQNISPSLKKIN